MQFLSVNTEQPCLDTCLSAAEFYSSSITTEFRCFSCLQTSNESIWLADPGNCFFCEILQSVLHGGEVFIVWFWFFFKLTFWEFPLGKKSPALCWYFYLDSGPKYILEFLMAVQWRLVFFAYYPACGIPLAAAQNHNVRKLCFDNMDIKKGFSLSSCNSLTTTAINLQQSTVFFSAVTSCLKRANCSFCKAKCNLALQVYMTDKFILIC